MTTSTVPISPVKIALPSREELRAMMTSPSVAITAIICLTLVALGALGGVIYLAATGRDAAVIGTLITLMIAGVGGLLHRRMGKVENAVKETAKREE